MSQYDGTAPGQTVRVPTEGIVNPGSSPVAMSGASFCIRSNVVDVVVQSGEPMLPARWDDVERLMEAHFERYESVMQRLA